MGCFTHLCTPSHCFSVQCKRNFSTLRALWSQEIFKTFSLNMHIILFKNDRVVNKRLPNIEICYFRLKSVEEVGW